MVELFLKFGAYQPLYTERESEKGGRVGIKFTHWFYPEESASCSN